MTWILDELKNIGIETHEQNFNVTNPFHATKNRFNQVLDLI